jgi:hypothetical protein
MHDPKYWNEQILTTWENSSHSIEERVRIGTRWFEERIQNQKQSWFSFTEDQHVDLPEGFDSTKTNIVIFNSSESEFGGMDDYNLPFYKTQNEGLLRIGRDLEFYKDIKVYLRVHPHLRDKDNSQTRYIVDELAGRLANFEVIPADAPVRSYSLMQHADAVVTFGSTVGPEAAYKGTPVILLGRSWYEDIEACTIPNSHDDFINLVATRSFKLSDEEVVQRKINALKFAYFFEVSGDSYKVFNQTDIFDIRYNGQSVSDEPPSYENGLKTEIAQRTDLNPLNPLTAAVVELKRVADELSSENMTLHATVASLEQQLEAASSSAAPQSRRHHYLNRLRQLKRSVNQKFQRLLNSEGQS